MPDAPAFDDDAKNVRLGLTDHLANERTLLAYVRTSIALTGFGLTLNRFALFLADAHSSPDHPGWARPVPQLDRLGLAMVLLGLVLLVWAAVNFHRVRRAIETGSYHAPVTFIAGLALLLIVLTLASVAVLGW
jgi:putative membrane protein